MPNKALQLTACSLRSCAARAISVTIPVHTGTGVGRDVAVRILKDTGYSVDDFLRLQ